MHLFITAATASRPAGAAGTDAPVLFQFVNGRSSQLVAFPPCERVAEMLTHHNNTQKTNPDANRMAIGLDYVR